MLAPLHSRTDLEMPCSIECEQSLLGAVIMNPDAYFATCDIVEAECFSEGVHGTLWTLAAERIERGERADPISLMAALGKDGQDKIGQITLKEYVARLAASATAVVTAPEYARTIRDLFNRRRLISFGQMLAYRAQGGVSEANVDELLEEADQELGRIRFGKVDPSIKWMHEAAAQSLALTAENYKSHEERRVVGLQTGILELEDLTGPLFGGDLITIAGPSGHGKTGLLTQILCAASEQTFDTNVGRPSFFVSQEMTATQIARRVLASWTQISTRRQRSGKIDEEDYNRLREAAGNTAHVRVLFDESGQQKASTIARKVRAMKRLHNIGAVGLDHLLLLKPEHPRDSKIETIERAVMLFKDLAKELNIVFFQLAQLTRESQFNARHWRFSSQALWGGDAIKQASDFVIGQTFPRKWLREREPANKESPEGQRWDIQMNEWQDRADIGALKIRDDDDGSWFPLRFDGSTMTFGSRTR